MYRVKAPIKINSFIDFSSVRGVQGGSKPEASDFNLVGRKSEKQKVWELCKELKRNFQASIYVTKLFDSAFYNRIELREEPFSWRQRATQPQDRILHFDAQWSQAS